MKSYESTKPTGKGEKKPDEHISFAPLETTSILKI